MASDLEIIYDKFAYVYTQLKEKFRSNPSSMSRQEDDFLVAAQNLYSLEYYKDFPDRTDDTRISNQYDNKSSRKLTLEKDGFTEDDFIFDPPENGESIDDKFSSWSIDEIN